MVKNMLYFKGGCLQLEGISMKALPEATHNLFSRLFFFTLSSLAMAVFFHQANSLSYIQMMTDCFGATLWCSSAHGQRVDFILLTM